MRLFDYGPRLNDEEYDRRIVALHSGLPPVPSKEQDMEVRRAELNLAIDHRLGCEFPEERRAALWSVQQRIDKKRIRLMFAWVLRRIFAKSLVRRARGLASYVVQEYARVLDDDELAAFFGEEEVRAPGLPLSAEQLDS